MQQQQGDQIGLIIGHSVTVYFGQVFLLPECPALLGYLSPNQVYELI
jgi:hypothetical protein